MMDFCMAELLCQGYVPLLWYGEFWNGLVAVSVEYKVATFYTMTLITSLLYIVVININEKNNLYKKKELKKGIDLCYLMQG